MEELRIQGILQKLSLEDDDRKDMLENLRTAIGNLNREEIVQQLSNVSLESLFQCLDTTDKDQIEATCDILKGFMFILDPVEVLSKYHEAMLSGSHHPDPQVKILVISQINRFIETKGELAASVLTKDYQHLILTTIKQIPSEDLSVSKKASQLCVNLSQTPLGADFILGPAGTSVLRSILDDSSEAVKFRIYETLSRIAIISPSNLQKIEAENILIRPLSATCFDNNDPLGSMNGLEILSTLLETDEGIGAVDRAGIFSKLQGLSGDWRNDPLSQLVFPGVLKFVAKLGVKQLPSDDILTMVTEAITESEVATDSALITAAFETLACIGTTPKGKVYLHTFGDQTIDKCFAKIKILVREAAIENRCRIMESLSILYESEIDKKSKILAQWFYLLFPDISYLFSLVQQPFSDIRLTVLRFFSALTPFEWALQSFLRLAGVLEFLMDRNIETDKECALAKFQIVKTLTELDSTKRILSNENMQKLEEHVRQGPFYAKMESNVAVEGS